MKLVFSNCLLYNGPNSEIGKVGIRIEEEFDKLCKELNLDAYLKDNNAEIKQEEKAHTENPEPSVSEGMKLETDSKQEMKEEHSDQNQSFDDNKFHIPNYGAHNDFDQIPTE